MEAAKTDEALKETNTTRSLVFHFAEKKCRYLDSIEIVYLNHYKQQINWYVDASPKTATRSANL